MSSTLWDPPTPPTTTPHPGAPVPGRGRRGSLAVGVAITALSIGALLTAVAALPSGSRAADAVTPATTATAAPHAAGAASVPPAPAAAAPVAPSGSGSAAALPPSAILPTGEPVSPSVLAGAQATAFAVGLASSSIGIGAAVVRQPELRSSSSVAAGTAVLQVTLARAAWSAVERPRAGRMADWYEAFDRAVTDLEAASDQLAEAVLPSTSDADAATLADEIDRHVDAAQDAIADATAALTAGT